MHDPGFMGASHRVGDLARGLQRLAQAHPLARDQLIERLAGDVLHDDEVGPALRRDVVDHDDVRVVQGARRLGFLHEPRLARRVGHALRRQHLDGYEAIQVGVAGFVHHTHAAFAELLRYLVVQQSLAEQGVASPR